MSKEAIAAVDTAATDRRARVQEALGEAGTEKRKVRRKMVIKTFSLLVKTPADDRGKIDGTPFSVASVERLMNILNKRASEADQQGSKAAAAMAKFLSEGDASAERVAGASVSKLRWIAEMGKRFRK